MRTKMLPSKWLLPVPGSPRGRILQAATRLFAEYGFEGTSTRAISDAAGVNLAMIHYYFGSKEQLYERALVTEFLVVHEKMQELVSSDLPAEDQILGIPVRALTMLKNRPQWAMLLRREMAGDGIHLKKALQSLGSYGPMGLQKLFEKKYGEALSRNRLRRLPPDSLRECLVAMGFGLFLLEPFFHAVRGMETDEEAMFRDWMVTITTLVREGLVLENRE